jgi:hypothetical protein
MLEKRRMFWKVRATPAAVTLKDWGGRMVPL